MGIWKQIADQMHPAVRWFKILFKAFVPRREGGSAKDASIDEEL
jgi:hypothetical protein